MEALTGVAVQAHGVADQEEYDVDVLLLYGKAADIKVSGVAASVVADFAETLMPSTGGIGRYSTFTHVDVRKVKSRWNG